MGIYNIVNKLFLKKNNNSLKDFINAIFFKLNTYKICPFKEAQIDTEDELCLSLILDLLQGKFISFQSLFICSLIFNFKKFNQECIIKQL